MGPMKAAGIFASEHADAARYEVELYGSLAATGKGHMTDAAISDVLEKTAPCKIIWYPAKTLPYHPNGMVFKAFDNSDKAIAEWTCYSIGGGSLSEGGEKDRFAESPEVYDKNTIGEIVEWCRDNGRSFWEYVELCEIGRAHV